MVKDAVIERYQKRVAIQQVFRPGAPIERSDLFSGRLKQMQTILSVIAQPGRHAALYGERGVGKTSLAKVMSEFLESSDPKILISGTINCDGTDDFSSLWHKVFRELSLTMQMKGFGFGGMPPDARYTLDSMLNSEVRPDDIRFTLSQIRQSIVILLDEFNSLLGRERVTGLLAETIKNISDHTLNVTIIIIGVADSVDELIAGHGSVGRSLEQILMPRMTSEELHLIIKKALAQIDMTMESGAEKWIVALSKGLPHFTHLLSLDAALSAFDAERREITAHDVFAGIQSAAGNEHSLMKTYQDAITSPQKTNRFAEVLLACANAVTDGLGWFAPADICQPLSEVTDRPSDVPAFSRHLRAFCKRGILQSNKAAARKIRYRFENPLMQPFVILQAIRNARFEDQRIDF